MSIEDRRARHLTIKDREYLVSPAEKPVNQSESRLGNPDLVGEWKGIDDGKFSVYLLRCDKANIVVDPDFPFTAFQIKGTLIEGVIFDRLGYSVISGIMTRDFIHFSKTYSALARGNDAARGDICYRGEYDEASGSYIGKYKAEDSGITGEFEIKRPKE